ncbi:MAG: ASKHA domain-containing protein [Candidatus Thorarchaeota archaeon]
MSEYGVSVDIGTSRISLHIVDITTQRVLVDTSIANPQIQYGLDVVTRIRYSLENPDGVSLTDLIRDCINGLLEKTLRNNSINTHDISTFVVVGNSVMHHFFFGLSPESLLTEPFVLHNKDSILVDAQDVGISLPRDTQCYSPPLVESFIGSDAIAVIVDSGLHESNETNAAIDIGTNTEIIISHDGDMSIASAASGPAFEGMTMECGMQAINGAIERIKIDPHTFESTIDTIGNSNPLGICGTGAISAIASLLDVGLLNRDGSLKRNLNTDWVKSFGSVQKFVVWKSDSIPKTPMITISQPDIRMLQHSKASIRATLEILLQHINCLPNEISKFYITGAFGTNLMIDDLVRIGMLPDFSSADIQQKFGGAIRGADIFLYDPNLRDLAKEIVRNLDYIELTEREEYPQMHVDAMFFPDSFQ